MFRTGDGFFAFIPVHGADFLEELVEVLKILVYGSETDACDFIKIAERFDRAGADFNGRNFAVVIVFNGEYEFVDESVDLFLSDGAFPACFFDAGAEFFPVEVLPGAVAFDYFEFIRHDFFAGGESESAVGTFAAAAHARSVLDGTRIDDFIVLTCTFRASHL